MPLALETLAARLDASIFRAGPDILGVSSLQDALPGDLSFFEDARYARALRHTQASSLILRSPLPELPQAQLIHPQPLQAVCLLLEYLYPSKSNAYAHDTPPRIHPTAVLHSSATIGAGVELGPHVVVEEDVVLEAGTRVAAGCYIGSGTHIGSDCTLHAGVKVLERCVIGKRVQIHAGTVIGSDGFGYRFDGKVHQKVPQLGGVVVGDDVEIGANCTLDRGTLGDTVIGEGCKLDNLVHVGHNVRVGDHSLLIAQVGISGSVQLGHRVILAGQVGVADHSEVGDGAIIVAQSGVHGKVAPGSVMAGTPIMPHPVWRRVSASLPRIPELLRTVRRLTSSHHTASDAEIP